MLRIWTVLVVTAGVARADPATREDVEKAATALFEQGRQLAAAGQQEAACDKFESSLRLDPQIGTKLNVAACREDKGLLVEAYELFESAALDADRSNKAGRATFARQRMVLLAHRLVRVRLAIATPDHPGLAITLGGRAIPKPSWARVHVLVPGPYLVIASAPGQPEQRFEQTAAAGTEVAIEVRAFDGTVVSPPGPAPIDAPRASRVPWILGGAGGLALIGSVAVGLHAKSRHGDAFDRQDRDGVASAQREADIATGIAVAGAVALTVGVVLYVRERRDRTSIVPLTSRDAVGVAAIGSF